MIMEVTSAGSHTYHKVTLMHEDKTVISINAYPCWCSTGLIAHETFAQHSCLHESELLDFPGCEKMHNDNIDLLMCPDCGKTFGRERMEDKP